eukprot:gene12314-24438_t
MATDMKADWHVVAVKDFKTDSADDQVTIKKSTLGKVVEVNAQGDVLVDFDGEPTGEWIIKKNVPDYVVGWVHVGIVAEWGKGTSFAFAKSDGGRCFVALPQVKDGDKKKMSTGALLGIDKLEQPQRAGHALKAVGVRVLLQGAEMAKDPVVHRVGRNDTFTGTVKKWNAARGYGFIGCREFEKDLYVHATDSEGVLNFGAKVNFKVAPAMHGGHIHKAVHVTVTADGPGRGRGVGGGGRGEGGREAGRGKTWYGKEQARAKVYPAGGNGDRTSGDLGKM